MGIELYCRLCVLGDMSGFIENRVRTNITDNFGVPVENKNGKRVMEFLAERGDVCG